MSLRDGPFWWVDLTGSPTPKTKWQKLKDDLPFYGFITVVLGTPLLVGIMIGALTWR